MQTALLGPRLRVFGAHLAVSALLVAVSVAMVLWVWYPGALATTEGVLPIIGLLALVDVCLGPLLTLVIASPRKTKLELRRDIAVIVVAQLGALSIALHSTYVARPVFVVFDVNRFETVSAAEISFDGITDQTKKFDWNPLSRPQWVYAEPPADIEERKRIVVESMSGGPEFKNLLRLFRAWPVDSAAVRNAAVGPNAIELKADEIAGRLAELDVQPGNVLVFRLLGRVSSGLVVVRRENLDILFCLPLRGG